MSDYYFRGRISGPKPSGGSAWIFLLLALFLLFGGCR
jgi:MYXO-CTERM domain-containing protein